MSSENILSTLCTEESNTKTNKTVLNATEIETPLGQMVAVADDQFLYVLCLSERDKMIKKIQTVKKELNADLTIGLSNILTQLKKELNDYFDGKLKKFTVPIKCLGTDFQKESWEGLMKLSYGSTMSYGELAVKIGRTSKHSRAMGAAAGANPIMIIIPCHRLTAHNENLGGFSSGLDRKIWLLKHETKYKDV